MKDRLIPFRENNTFTSLTEEEQDFIQTMAENYFLTFQDIKILIDISKDLQTWGEGTLKDYWRIPEEKHLKGKQLKQAIVEGVKQQWNNLRTEKKDYSHFKAETDSSDLKINYIETENENIILGKCPVASIKTRCCNLQTLDVVNNCGFDCTYCSIQSFFDNNRVYFQSNLAEKLQNLNIDPEKRYHIGTGQSSDSLMWGNQKGILDLLADFARKNPNVILELKTKSKNISWFLENDVPSNIIITWSLNTDTIIENEEHLTATLDERLNCARKISDRGIITGFHFHPMVYYKGWEEEYGKMFRKLQTMFTPEEIALISLGTLTFIKPVIKKIRDRNIKSKILQMPMEEAGGKLSYPLEIKNEMFHAAYSSFSQDWKDNIFFYMCMEDERLWEPVFGRSYKSNEEFESDMIDSYFKKVSK
jgi:spore photoproduct lyase